MRTRSTITAVLAALAALALVRCSDDFPPASQVSGLRVLGMRAEPAEPRPGDLVSLQALVVDPSRPDAGNAVLWFGCEPSLDPRFNACSNEDVLQALTTVEGDGGLPAGLRFLGAGDQVVTQLPADVFAGIDAGDPVRVRGVLAEAIAIAAAAPPPQSADAGFALLDQVRKGSVKHVTALFRYPVSENPEPNHNPVLLGYRYQGQPLAAGAAVRLQPSDAGISIEADPSSFEQYLEAAPAGSIDRTESLAAAFFASVGALDEGAVEVSGTVEETISPPDALSVRQGRLWTVVRDTRGGQSWISAPIWVCDPSAPSPTVDQISRDGGIELRGSELDQVLEVQVGTEIAPGLRCSDSECTAALPRTAGGDDPIEIRTKNCQPLMLSGAAARRSRSIRMRLMP
jgi:hypothetical protein